MGTRATNYVALRALMTDHGWSDASNATEDRLTAHGGRLVLIVNRDGSLDIKCLDFHTGDTVTIRISGHWSFGTVRNLIMHLMMVDSLMEAKG